MKKVFAFLLACSLFLQADVVTAFAEAAEETAVTETAVETETEAETEASALPSDEAEGKDKKFNWPIEMIFSNENINLLGGKYSYKLVLRPDGTLTFDNSLEILYQGVDGRYQLSYEIDKSDNHIMIVTGYFENIITESPLMKLLSDEEKNWILTHVSEDSYYYQLDLRTKEGFTFTNTLKFLYDSKPLGYSLYYAYDLFTKKQTLNINRLPDAGQAEETTAAAAEAN